MKDAHESTRTGFGEVANFQSAADAIHAGRLERPKGFTPGCTAVGRAAELETFVITVFGRAGAPVGEQIPV
jgi:hypothetical protein